MNGSEWSCNALAILTNDLLGGRMLARGGQSGSQFNFATLSSAQMTTLQPVSESRGAFPAAPLSFNDMQLLKCDPNSEGSAGCHADEKIGDCGSLFVIGDHPACNEGLQASDVTHIAAVLEDGLSAEDWTTLRQYGPAIRVAMGAPHVDVVGCGDRVIARFPIAAPAASTAQ